MTTLPPANIMRGWPMGSKPTDPTVRVSRPEIEALAADADKVLAMLKRGNVLLAGCALAVEDSYSRRYVLDFVEESSALVRRLEGKK